ncbi:MAG: DUF3160 domain-containing protein [Patescibacteria group bacterium]
MRNQRGIAIVPLVIIIVVIAALGVGGYVWFTQKDDSTTTNTTPTTTNSIVSNVDPNSFVDKLDIPTAQASEFATYQPVTVSVTPQVPAYTVTDDFSNVNNKDQVTFLLAYPDAKAKLLQNGFVVYPGYHDEYYSLYERHRYQYTPSFVTVDSMMHTYHLLFDYLLRQAEENFLIGKLTDLNVSMLAGAQAQYDQLKGTEWENAAKRDLAFLSVGSVLLDPSVAVPSDVKSLVSQELALINAHDGIHTAVIMNLGVTDDTFYDTPQGPLPLDKLKEDYSQYIPRGHYDRSDQLKNYFKSMMWYGRMTFRMKSDDEIRSAMLITLLLKDAQRQNMWESIYEPTNFFVGKSDDITYRDFSVLLGDTYGASIELASLPTNTAAFTTLKQGAAGLEPPEINSIPIFQSSIQPDRDAEITGFRFMGQRFTIDASIMQRLVCRDVGNQHGTMECGGTVPDSRMVPSGLDIPAAMGSQEAYNILDVDGATKYLRYPENMKLLQDYLDGLDTSVWTQNLYWGWLYALKPLVEPATAGYPAFMQNQAWARKELQTYLGSWTELKHDTILYAKQVYAELGGGPPPQYDDRGYVEPYPDVFARLAVLTKMTREGLDQRDLISDGMQENLKNMETLSLSLKMIAEKELNNVSRTAEEYELIRSYGGQLEHFWLAVNQADMDASGQTQDEYLNNNPAPIVADVATDPNGFALEEATGKIDTVFVLVNVEGVTKVAQGGVYSYYEFLQPLANRLTDTAWRELLNSDQRPDRPSWENAFLFVPTQ